MRYFLIAFLLIPIFYSNAQEVNDASSRQRAPMGSVTTRSNSPVVTRSADVKNKKPMDRSKAIWYPKGKAPKYKKEPLKTSEDVNPDSMQGIFKEEALGYRKEAARLQANNDLTNALAFYKKALEFDPNNLETMNDIGVLYESLNDTVTAAAVDKKIIELNPQYLPAYTNLGFLYEAKNDTRNATYYWQKRYELGKEGDYWTNMAKQHLINLGTYPEVYRAKVDKEASRLAEDLAYGREERTENNITDARLHFYMETRLYDKKDYGTALKELETALSLNPQDENLRLQILDFYKKTEDAYAKDKMITQTQDALNYMKDDNYYTAEEKLRGALSTVYSASQEK
ncbi:MAG: tetratricopeptide repeat protein [Candidatus Omnitrophica bacterium]|nr:tetratricopeptide repeat protein [Candidatus Omnitrophota bacterium]